VRRDALRREAARPSLIIVRSHIGFGSPRKQDTADAHGAPLGADEVAATKRNLAWPTLEPFHVPPEALAHWRTARERGAALEADWRTRFAGYRAAHPELAAELERRLAGALPDGWDAGIPVFGPRDAQATRAASGKVLNAIAPHLPELIGGSADLTGSNNTDVKGAAVFQADRRDGRNFHFGVREHAMGAILNGLALHRGFIPYGGTFLVFSDYLRPALRVAALSHLRPIFVFTHDSIGLGEDGPTHQPVEHLAALRAIPNVTVIRPADATEVAEAWRAAIRHTGGPVALVLTRQKVPVVDRSIYAPADGLHRGGYVLADAAGAVPAVILIGTGSEVELVIGAYERLRADGVRARAVSMPSLELFGRQPQAYRDAVLPPAVTARVAVEAGSPQPWARWVGDRGAVVGIDRFGASAPYQRIYQEFGLTVDGVVARAKDLLSAD
jgi:transketolase